MKLLERTRVTLQAQFKYSICFPLRVSSSRFIIIIIFFSKGEREEEEEGIYGHASIPTASSDKTYFAFGTVYRVIIVEGETGTLITEMASANLHRLFSLPLLGRCLGDFSKETMPIIINEP